MDISFAIKRSSDRMGKSVTEQHTGGADESQYAGYDAPKMCPRGKEFIHMVQSAVENCNFLKADVLASSSSLCLNLQ